MAGAGSRALADWVGGAATHIGWESDLAGRSWEDDSPRTCPPSPGAAARRVRSIRAQPPPQRNAPTSMIACVGWVPLRNVTFLTS